MDKKTEFIIGGDFNAHSPLWGSSNTCTNGRLIRNWYDQNKDKLKINIKSSKNPTCSVSSNGSFIDFAIISDSSNVINCDTENKLPSRNIFSDYAVIFLDVSCEPVKLIDRTKIKVFKKTNWNKFNEFIDNKLIELKIPLNRNMNTQSVDDVCNSIENILKNTCPKSKFLTRTSNCQKNH